MKKLLNIEINSVVREIDQKLETLYGNLSEEDNHFLKMRLKQMGRESYQKWIHEHRQSIYKAVKNTRTLQNLPEWDDYESRLFLILAVFQMLQSARIFLRAAHNNFSDQSVPEEHIPFHAGLAYSFLLANRPPAYPFDFDDPFSS